MIVSKKGTSQTRFPIPEVSTIASMARPSVSGGATSPVRALGDAGSEKGSAGACPPARFRRKGVSRSREGSQRRREATKAKRYETGRR